jgi:hypothetical protein
MRRFVICFVIGWIVTGAAVYWSAHTIQRRYSGPVPSSEIGRQLHREAQLIEHFCLSRIPPSMGPAAALSEWEKALGISIRLREGLGEVLSEAPELKGRSDDIRALEPGQSVHSGASSGGGRHVLVYRPRYASRQLLVMVRPESSSSGTPGAGHRIGPLGFALIAGALAGAVLCFAQRLLIPDAPAKG